MNDTIDTIKRALEAATQGVWWHFQTNDSIVCDVTEPIHMRKNIADILSRNHADTQLIANSPTWLLYLLGEVERLKGERDHWERTARYEMKINAAETLKGHKLMFELSSKDEAFAKAKEVLMCDMDDHYRRGFIAALRYFGDPFEKDNETSRDNESRPLKE